MEQKRGELEAVPGTIPLGERLVRAGVLDEATLSSALERQRQTGERLGRILTAAGSIHRLDLQLVLAEQWNLPFVDLFERAPDPELAHRCDPERLLAEGWIPVRPRGWGRSGWPPARRPPASSSPRSARASTSAGRSSSTSDHTARYRARGDHLLSRLHLIDRSTAELRTRRPEHSAATGLSLSQRLTIALTVLAAVAASLVFGPRAALSAFVVAANLVFFAAVSFKLVACIAGLGGRDEGTPAARIADSELPLYTILVPVYGEANVIHELIANLAELDYPAEKLEILILLEADDEPTIAAARAARPPASVRLVVVPDAEPKTKPKACNVGLFLARVSSS